jgi:hypothetical protein
MPGHHQLSSRDILKIFHCHFQYIPQFQFFWNVIMDQDLLPPGAGQISLLLVWWLSQGNTATQNHASLVCNSLERNGIEFRFHSPTGINITDKDLMLLSPSEQWSSRLEENVPVHEFFLAYIGSLSYMHHLKIYPRQLTSEDLSLILWFPNGQKT